MARLAHRTGLAWLVFGSVALVLTAACTVLSGIDDLETGKGDGGKAPVGVPDASPDVTVGPPTVPPPLPPPAPPPPPSSSSCTGALGQWSTCNTDTVDTATCATRCARIGLTCVQSCCAYDTSNVPFVGDAGLALAFSNECPLSTEPADALLGSCATPATADTSVSVRCCCR